MTTIMKHTHNDGFDLTSYIHELAGSPISEQYAHSDTMASVRRAEQVNDERLKAAVKQVREFGK